MPNLIWCTYIHFSAQFVRSTDDEPWWTRLGEEDLEGVLGLGAQRRDAHLDRCGIDGSRKERWLVRERSCKSHDSLMEEV